MPLPAGPALPAAVQTLYWIVRPLQFMTACRRKYGDVFTVRLTGLGPTRELVFLADPQGVREVFGGDPATLLAGGANAPLEPLLGRYSVLLLDGAEHLRQRKLMLPPLHGERMRAYESVMRDVTLERMATWPRGEAFALLPEMQRITLDVILRTVFGLDEGAQMTRMRSLLQRMLRFGSGRTRMLAFAFARVELKGRGPWGEFMAARREVDDALFEQIRLRRGGDASQRSDVLSLLLEARDESGEPMSDEELRDELLTLLVAGHETTATALAWTFDLLLHRPATLRRLLASLDGGDTRLLDAAIKESLRLRPVLPIVARQLQSPFRVLGQELPAGTVVAPCIYLTQRREDVYPEPLRFKPERFLDGAPDPYAWLPFGGGIRRCLGASFATFEMRVVLRTVLSGLELRAASPALERVSRRAITLVPRTGTRVACAGERARLGSEFAGGDGMAGDEVAAKPGAEGRLTAVS
jgi:cytochrome P450 family 135